MADNILNGHKDEIQSDNGYVLKAYNLTKKYNEGLPSMVTAIEDCMVKALFLAGHKTVIVDATHTTYGRRERWRLPAWELDYKIFTTHQDICKNRAIMDGRGDLIPIIEHMATNCDVVEINDINFP